MLTFANLEIKEKQAPYKCTHTHTHSWIEALETLKIKWMKRENTSNCRKHNKIDALPPSCTRKMHPDFKLLHISFSFSRLMFFFGWSFPYATKSSVLTIILSPFTRAYLAFRTPTHPARTRLHAKAPMAMVSVLCGYMCQICLHKYKYRGYEQQHVKCDFQYQHFI